MRHIPELAELQLPAPEQLRGTRIVFCTDIHLRASFRPEEFAPTVERIRSLDPDLVLWGGDYAESRPLQYAFFRAVSVLRPRMGMYGVIGNNDKECFGKNFPYLRVVAERAGVHMLINEEARVGKIRIAGPDECKHGHPSTNHLLRGLQPDEYSILLCHYPQGLDMLQQSGITPDLALTGHTHGGQISLFGLSCYNFGYGLPREKTSHRYITGLHTVNGSRLLISNGIGESVLPVRIGAPRQLHLITLI